MQATWDGYTGRHLPFELSHWQTLLFLSKIGTIPDWYNSRGVRLAHCTHRLTNNSVNCTLLLHMGVATVKRAETGVEPQKR